MPQIRLPDHSKLGVCGEFVASWTAFLRLQVGPLQAAGYKTQIVIKKYQENRKKRGSLISS